MSTTENAGPAGDVDLAGSANLAFLEELFERYQQDPSSVDPAWRASFEALAAEEGFVAPSGGGRAARGVAPPIRSRILSSSTASEILPVPCRSTWIDWGLATPMA